MRSKLIGLVIVVLGIAIAWADVAIGRAHASGWIVALIGETRVQANAPLGETLFDLIIFAPLIVVALIGGLLERRNVLQLGELPARALAIGLLVGFAGLTVSMLYAKLAGVLVPGTGTPITPGLLAWGFAAVALQTGAEEIFFRGWMQPTLVARWGAAAGVGVTAVAFGLLHVAGGARAPVSLLNLVLGGVMFGLFALRTGGLAGVLGLHFAWNASEELIFGLDPNGQYDAWMGSFRAIADYDIKGAAIWGGSEDGLNGSIGMTIALLAILAPLALLSWRRLKPAAPPVGAPLTT